MPSLNKQYQIIFMRFSIKFVEEPIKYYFLAIVVIYLRVVNLRQPC